ncbi:MAG: DUF983 domain-containing protein [Pseudomonadota bacterium]
MHKRAVELIALLPYETVMAKKNKTLAQEPNYLTQSLSKVGLGNCCPRCGQGKLFIGMLKPHDACIHCGLDYAFIDSGDGPAVFVILIIGFVVTAFAMALQTALSPPLWLHMLIWIPLIVILSVLGLRIAKGIMIALQYQTRAKQGEIGERL